MTAVKERIIGAVSIMSDKDANICLVAEGNT